MNSSNEMISLLKLIITILEKITPDELYSYLEAELKAGNISNKKIQKKTVKKPANKALANLASDADLNYIYSSLQQLNNREEGRALVSPLKRKELEGLARLLSIPVLKGDNVERLQEKL